MTLTWVISMIVKETISNVMWKENVVVRGRRSGLVLDVLILNKTWPFRM